MAMKIRPAIWVAIVPILVIGYGVSICWTLDAKSKFLLKQVDHRAISMACLELITKPEYQPLIGSFPSGTDPRLPSAIRDIKPIWLTVNSNSVLIVKTGGHYHMGYFFRPNVLVTNQYDLVFVADGGHEIPLCFVRGQSCECRTTQ